MIGDVMNALLGTAFSVLQPEIGFARFFEVEIGAAFMANGLEDIRKLKAHSTRLAIAAGCRI